MSPRRSAVALGLLLLSVAMLAGCGGDGDTTTTGAATAAGELGDLTAQELAASVESQAPEFLGREGTVLHRNLQRALGGKIVTTATKGSAECRTGKETASIADPAKYPFACIVEGSAAAEGLSVNITLGFVGLSVDDRCWRAAIERISITTSAPALVTRKEAKRPVNQIAACA